MPAPVLDAAALADMAVAVASVLSDDPVPFLAECSRANIAAHLVDDPEDAPHVRAVPESEIRLAITATLRATDAQGALTLLRDGMRDDGGCDHASPPIVFGLARLAAAIADPGSTRFPDAPDVLS